MEAGEASGFKDSKPHYAILDGLRGVAALLVLIYHVMEGFAFVGETSIKGMNHGYLAVDFFFILSGFVIGYAYDDRLGRSMSVGDFFKRRFIRLHPMVVVGAVAGAVCFMLQGSVTWDGHHISAGAVMLSLLCALLFIPAFPGSSYEVRGNGEAFPLNGPAWSLFFEYIGNIAYALVLHRLPTSVLRIVVALLGFGVLLFTTMSGEQSFGVGWSMGDYGFWKGMLRMMFPFGMGLLLSRCFVKREIKGAFPICSVVLLLLFIVPELESGGMLSLNGLYESACIILVFPVLVWIGACGSLRGKWTEKVCRFVGDISFPLYITHYPVMYLFYAWLKEEGITRFADCRLVATGVVVLNIALAYTYLKLYDIPVRKWLAGRFIYRKR